MIFNLFGKKNIFGDPGMEDDDMKIETVRLDMDNAVDISEPDKSFMIYANGAIDIVGNNGVFKYRTIDDLREGLVEDFNFAYTALNNAYEWAKESNIGDSKTFGNHIIKTVEFISKEYTNPKPFNPPVRKVNSNIKTVYAINKDIDLSRVYKVEISITEKAKANIENKLTENEVLEVVGALYINNDQIKDHMRDTMRKAKIGVPFTLFSFTITPLSN